MQADATDQVASNEFSFRTLYIAGLLACALSYFGIVGLVALSVAAGSGNVAAAFGTMLFGLFYTLLPSALIGTLIVAPVGAAIAHALARVTQAPVALGALSGLATTLMIWVALFALFAEFREAPDWGSLTMLAGTVSIGAFSGALALNATLRPSGSFRAA